MNRFFYIIFALLICIVTASCGPSHKNPSGAVQLKTPKQPAITVDTLQPVKITELDLRALVDTLNDYLVSYDTIHPMSDYDKADLKRLKLTKSDIDTLLQDTGDHGTVTGSSVSMTYQIVIDSLLTKVLKHPQIVKYDLDRILKMAVSKSDDGKLYNLILPENTGGSYQSSLSYIHYRADNGKVYNFFPDHEHSDGTNFNGDGFEYIHALNTTHGVKYVLQGSVRGCNTCRGDYIQLVHFERGKAIVDFSLSAGERDSYNPDEDEQGITYDEKKNLIILTHNASDDQECDCRTDAEREKEEEQPELRIAKNWLCIFKFNGDTFVLDKRKSRSPE